MKIIFGRRSLNKLVCLSLFLSLAATTQLLNTSSVLAADNAEQSHQEITILTSLPVTYFLSSALTADTNIKVLNLPKRGRRINGQANYFESKAEKLAETFKAATAVVTIGKLWREDPLFTAARSANIRIVEIDATKPWSSTLEGVSVAMRPQQDSPWVETAKEEPTPSIFFWLSITNSIRSADIIARDLIRLTPDMATKIELNLNNLRSRLLGLQRQGELALLNAPDVSVFSLAPEIVYLTSDLGLFVDGSFYKQDIEWTEADIAALGKHLKDNDIGVVLHKWEPAEPILNALKAANVNLVVIETLDAGIVKKGSMLADSYFTMMATNLENLRAAFVN
jgi:ABC-type Zn uptake system ZnuABC Zn-binding protein ZnuA